MTTSPSQQHPYDDPETLLSEGGDQNIVDRVESGTASDAEDAEYEAAKARLEAYRK